MLCDLVLEDDIHLVDLAVAAHATHAAIHVGGVIEVGVVGHVVDLDPRDRLAAWPSCRAPAGASGCSSGRRGGNSCRSAWWENWSGR